MANKLTLTRDQLATFLKDHEQIKQFERLILLVQTNLESGIVAGIDDTLGNVLGAVNSVSAQVQALLDALERQPPARDMADLDALDRNPPARNMADLEALLLSAPPPYPDLSDWYARLAGLESIPPAVTASGASLAPIAVTPGASPYTYVNETGYEADMIVSIGTVTLVEFGRAGVFTNTGLVAGIFRLSPFDSICVTYAVAPTMTLITR